MQCLKCWFQEYELASQTALKKAKKAWTLDCKKAGSNAKKEDEKAQKEKEEAENRAKNLEEAKKITITEDASKPAAQLSKIVRLEALRGQRVKVFGWVHRLRRQGNFFIFLNWFNQNLILISVYRQSYDVYHSSWWYGSAPVRSLRWTLSDLWCPHSEHRYKYIAY